MGTPPPRAGRIWRVTFSVALLAITACGPSVGSLPQTPTSADASAGPSANNPGTDKLAQVLDRGTLVLSTDLAYAPQSMAVDGAQRLADTRCRSNQLTAPEVAGYDVDTGKAVAAALGVEPCFVTPSWTEITGGNWGDRWDVSWGSGSINADRMQRLWMTQPYYGVPNNFYVRADSPFRTAEDLSGKEIGVCASCSQEDYLKGALEIPGATIVVTVKDPAIASFETEPPGLQAVVDGGVEAFLCAAPVGQQAIDDGLALRALDLPAFTYYPSGFVDKSSGLESRAFVERVSEIVEGLHADGTLKALSLKYFGVDYASAGATFDLAATGQALK